jgi:hypothetical protein
MIRLIFLSVFLFSATVNARAEDFGFWRIGANVNIVGNDEINQTAMEWHPAMGLEVGYDFEPWSLGVAWRHMNMDSESGGLGISSKEDRLMLIGRRYWHGDTDWMAWLQAGVGTQWYTTELDLTGGSGDNLQSDRELVTGIGAGFAWPLSPNWRSEIGGQVNKTQTRSSLEASASVSLVYLL